MISYLPSDKILSVIYIEPMFYEREIKYCEKLFLKERIYKFFLRIFTQKRCLCK